MKVTESPGSYVETFEINFITIKRPKKHDVGLQTALHQYLDLNDFLTGLQSNSIRVSVSNKRK